MSKQSPSPPDRPDHTRDSPESRGVVRADWRLLGVQVWAATARRPGRSLLLSVGVALGIATFLITMGWSQTTNSQINATFDRLSATTIRLRDTRADTATDAALNEDFETDVARINGVVAGGRLWVAGTPPVTTTPGADPTQLTMLVADPGYFTAAQTTLAAGRYYACTPTWQGQPVAVLGPGAAASLGITAITANLAIQAGTTRLLVVGILDTVGSATELNDAVIVPPTAPVGDGGTPPTPLEMSALIRVQLGTATTVAPQIPAAVRPQDPDRIGVIVPPEPANLRAGVQDSLDTLAYGTAALSLLIGMIAITTSMLSAITQRASEIGLRRALGARPRHIVTQFVTEGALLGVLGATLGTLLGQAALITIAATNGWAPVLDHHLLALAPAGGLIIGTLAATYPATKAAHIKPATTLRTT